MNPKFIEEVPTTIQYLIKSRLRDLRELDSWSLAKICRVDPGLIKESYIQLWFSPSLMKYQYATDLAFEKAKDALRGIFGSDMIWFQIPKNTKMDAGLGRYRNEFWIVINDINHRDTWKRIK